MSIKYKSTQYLEGLTISHQTLYSHWSGVPFLYSSLVMLLDQPGRLLRSFRWWSIAQDDNFFFFFYFSKVNPFGFLALLTLTVATQSGNMAGDRDMT